MLKEITGNNVKAAIGISIFVIAIICGCSSGVNTKDPAIKNEVGYHKSFDEMWSYIVEYFAVNNIPIKTINREEGTITSEIELTKEDFFKFTECTKGLKTTEIESPRLLFTINVRPDIDNSTYITSSAKFVSNISVKDKNDLIEIICPSNSSYEKAFFDYLEAKANETIKPKE